MKKFLVTAYNEVERRCVKRSCGAIFLYQEFATCVQYVGILLEILFY